MDLHTALLQGQKLLEDARIPVPRLAAEVLLAHAVGRDRAWLFAHSDEPLSELAWIHYGRFLHDRLRGTPTQYITGRQEFFGREFRVTTDVLIPRPETEHVVEAALERAGPASAIVDIGTGSGAIAVSLSLESRAQTFATDISAAALSVAADNSRRLGASLGLVRCDLGSALADAAFDMVVSNPPYVPEGDSATLQREVREHEPALALYGGADGFAIYRRLVPEAARLLKPGGWLVMEISYNSSAVVGGMLKPWRDVEVRSDLAGLPRVVTARR